MARVLENARYLRDGLEARGFAVVAPQPLPSGGDVVTPIVPVLVGDDWKAVLLWRALYDAGVFVNTALHPAVPPGGALLRTSVMATHDRDDARPRARRLRVGQGRASRPSTARCPVPARTDRNAGRPTPLASFSRPARDPSPWNEYIVAPDSRRHNVVHRLDSGAFGLSVSSQDSDGRKKAL